MAKEAGSQNCLLYLCYHNNPGKGRRISKSRVRDRLPIVQIVVPLTAVRVSLSGREHRSVRGGGMTLTSEPVSIK